MNRHICLIDADSKIPNLALMRLSTYHKAQRDVVNLIRLDLPYYPNKKKKHFYVDSFYDTTYCSVVFEGNLDYIHGKNIIFGGTGYDLITTLPECAESLEPDYSIYPDNDTSYGFISRGCIRNCSFCYVPRKEGHIRQVATIDDIVRHKKVKFMDNNFLALPNHISLLQELIDKNIHCQFNQGLDIRLLTEENSTLLSKLNYLGDYIFAFDDLSYLPIIEHKLKLLNWRKPFQLKFFVFCSPEMPLSNVCKRIEYLKENQILPYLMRHISCWESEYNAFYIDLAAYCNQPGIFKKLTFSEFLKRRHNYDNKRVLKHCKLYYESIK